MSPSLDVNVPTMREPIDDSLLSDGTLPGQPLDESAASSSKSMPLEMQRPSSQPSRSPIPLGIGERAHRELCTATYVPAACRAWFGSCLKTLLRKDLDNLPQLDGLPGERRPMVLLEAVRSEAKRR